MVYLYSLCLYYTRSNKNEHLYVAAMRFLYQVSFELQRHSYTIFFPFISNSLSPSNSPPLV